MINHTRMLGLAVVLLLGAMTLPVLAQNSTAGDDVRAQAAEARRLGARAFPYDTRAAIGHYQTAIRLEPDNPDSWNQLGHLLRRVGQLEQSNKAYRNVLAIATRRDDTKWIASATGNLGINHHVAGDLDKAEEMHRRALALNEKIGLKSGISSQLGNLGLVFQAQEKYEKAMQMHERSLAIETELDRQEGIASELGNLGVVHLNLGNLQRAETMFTRALTIELKLGRAEQVAISFANLGWVKADQGDLANACRRWQNAHDLYRQLQAEPMIKQLQTWQAEAGCKTLK